MSEKFEVTEVDVEVALTELGLPNGDNDVGSVMEWLDTDRVENVTSMGATNEMKSLLAQEDVKLQIQDKMDAGELL